VSERDLTNGGSSPGFLPDQQSSSASPPCSSKSLYDFDPDTSSYVLLSVLDLKDAFICIPLHPKSQLIFAFEDPTRKSGQVTWTVIPQRFRDSPHFFAMALAQDLVEWQYPQATLL
jgi:hypothetical protein